MNHTAQELFEILNDQDECPWIEAKGGSDSSHSVMETVCAFANEPGLGGGYILMEVVQDSEPAPLSTPPLSTITKTYKYQKILTLKD